MRRIRVCAPLTTHVLTSDLQQACHERILKRRAQPTDKAHAALGEHKIFVNSTSHTQSFYFNAVLRILNTTLLTKFLMCEFYNFTIMEVCF